MRLLHSLAIYFSVFLLKHWIHVSSFMILASNHACHSRKEFTFKVHQLLEETDGDESDMNDVSVDGTFDDPADEAMILEQAELREKLAKHIQDSYSKVIYDGVKYSTTAAQISPDLIPTKQLMGYDTREPGDQNELRTKIDRALKIRAYPLFLLEKAAHTVEDMMPRYKPHPNQKEKLLVIGTGWSSVAFIKKIDTTRFDVTVISPRNYFVFTPMLPGSTVGTVEYRSITSPIRSVNPNVDYIEAAATDVDIERKRVICVGVACDGSTPCSIEEFSVPYDRLLIAVGAQTSTFGVPGVKENCCFLKDIDDARTIRRAIVSLFESTNRPDVGDEETRKLLTFAIVGTGPSGIEFSAELRDFVEHEGAKYYPKLLQYVKIKLFDHSKNVLNALDKNLQDTAVSHITREAPVDEYQFTELYLGSGVKEVKRDRLILTDGKDIPFGLCLWAAGNGPLPLTLDLIKKLGKDQQELQQFSRGRLAVDPWMRVIGGRGDIFAVGDCSCSSCHQKGKAFPATAQVASQQAEYLATLLSKGTDMTVVRVDGTLLPPMRNKNEAQMISDSIASFAMNNDDFVAPFQYLDLGMSVYIGGEKALAQLRPLPNGTVGVSGGLGFGIWQSVYLAKQMSWKNRIQVLYDWFKTKTFGRDITQL